MKFYLSSYRIGNEVKELKKLIPKNRKTAYVSNALDAWNNLKKRRKHEKRDIKELASLGLKVELIDLRYYFERPKKLRKKLMEFGVIWVSGGNTFALRQAMKLSGFDNALKKFAKGNRDLLYGGYSAGICVLSPSLKGIELVDDSKAKPYKKQSRVIWKGLGLIDYSIAPHYKSDHPESKAMNKVVEYYIKHKMRFKALRDGEVIIII